MRDHSNARLIFLDVDGVMNNTAHMAREALRVPTVMSSGRMPLDPENVQQLRRVLRTVPDSRIVVSSSWRYAYPTLEQMRARLGRDGVPRRRIIGLTPFDHNDSVALEAGGNDRGHQIRAWLAWNAPDCSHYAIIDDDSDAGFTHDAWRFIRTDARIGLSRTEADRVIRVLTAATSLASSSTLS